MLNADIKQQDMSISGHPQEPDVHSHLSLQISGIVRNGIYKNTELEFQVSRKIDFDPTQKYAGGLIKSKPILMFTVLTDTERFGHLVSLVANKAFKDLYLCFEPPKYGKARVISWQLSTSIDE